MNAELAMALDQVGAILSGTLVVDDFVDLNELRATANHVPFDIPSNLATATPSRPPSADSACVSDHTRRVTRFFAGAHCISGVSEAAAASAISSIFCWPVAKLAIS